MKMIDNLKLEKEILNAYKKDLEQGFINKNTTYQKYRKKYLDKMNKEKITNHNLNILTGFLYQTIDTNKELSSEINNILDLIQKTRYINDCSYSTTKNTDNTSKHSFTGICALPGNHHKQFIEMLVTTDEKDKILDLLIKYNSKMNTQGLRLHIFPTESVSIKIEGLQESEINITKKSYEGDLFSTYDKIKETKTDNIIINNSSNHKKL